MCEVCPGIETYTGKIWSSIDGWTWDEIAVPGLEGSTLYAVASGPGGLVAFGWQALDGSIQPQVLVSSDGTTWTRVPVPAFEMPGISISDVIGGSPYVATGVAGVPGQNGQPAVWTSLNGRDWVEVYRSPDDGATYQITEGGPGWVAVGEVYRPTGGGDRQYVPFPAAWVSADGVTWEQQDLPLGADAGGGAAQAVLNLSLGPGMVAVGYAEYAPLEPPGPVIGFAGWRSSNGVTWEPAPVTADFLEDIGGGHLLYQGAGRVFAIGSGCRCGTGWPGRWWTTLDGLAWTEHREAPPVLYSVIQFGGGLLAVGLEANEGAIFVSE